jgi:drug/metabolite transporter (DMT)-like permease
MLFAAGSIWGVFTVLLRRWGAPAIPTVAAVSVISMLIAVPIWLPLRAEEMLDQPLGRLLWLVFAQGVMLGAGSMLLYAKSVELLGATRAASLSVVMPVMALIFAWAILGETIGWLPLGGAAMAVGGMLAAVLFTGRRTG